jgi:ubiquinone/menaquinone biosynthesis C-methylase UbiE
VTIERASKAYGSRAAEYTRILGNIDATAPADRELISSWARAHPDGSILDVGCGPGHWTNWLHERGIDIEGVDPAPEFVDAALRRFPGVRFRVGRAEQLDVADSSLAGILAWYSLIHLSPDRMPEVLAEFARALAPGGGLLVGFFDGARLEPFDHAITTAHYWPIDHLSFLIEQAGFAVTAHHTRVDPGTRPHGAIVARRGG